jgi:hypothetical protein
MAAVSGPLVGDLGPASTFAVQSSTDPERAYLVVRFDGIVDDDWAMRGQWRCCCRAGLNGVPCRHIEAVKARLEWAKSLTPEKPVRHLCAVRERNA